MTKKALYRYIKSGDIFAIETDAKGDVIDEVIESMAGGPAGNPLNKTAREETPSFVKLTLPLAKGEDGRAAMRPAVNGYNLFL